MGNPLWHSDPSENVEIIEPSLEAIDDYGRYHGCDFIVLKKEHIQALLKGKSLAWNNGEYSTFVKVEDSIVKGRKKVLLND